jgi:hypothetical protein
MLFAGHNAYKVGRYRADSKQNYVMEPKTGLGLEPLSIEVKVNPADLPKIRILDQSMIWYTHRKYSRKSLGTNSFSVYMAVCRIRIQFGQWIRIPDPDPGGQK